VRERRPDLLCAGNPLAALEAELWKSLKRFYEMHRI